MRNLLAGMFAMLSATAYADTSFYQCIAKRNYVLPGCPKAGCFDVSVGVNQNGVSKATIWHSRDAGLMRKRLLELGKVQNAQSPIVVDGSEVNLEENKAAIQIASIELHTNTTATYGTYPIMGTAKIRANSGDRSLTLECYSLSPERFHSWANGVDNGSRRYEVMMDLYKEMQK